MRLSLSLSAWLFCVAIATVASQSGCTSSQSGPGGSTDTKRIIFLTNGDDPFWDGAEEGLNLAAKAASRPLSKVNAAQRGAVRSKLGLFTNGSTCLPLRLGLSARLALTCVEC